jgi:hypothetical protein
MANAIYPKFKQSLMTAKTGVAIDVATMSVAICNSTYAYAASHAVLNDITAGLVANNDLTTPAVYANGTFEDSGAASITFTAVPAGTAIESLVIYKWNTSGSDSHVVAYLDTNVTNLPVTPNGGDITITWDTSGIFTL